MSKTNSKTSFKVLYLEDFFQTLLLYGHRTAWPKIVKRDPCIYCGNIPKPLDRSREHIIPQSLGGENTWDNVVGACQKCNQSRDKVPFVIYLIKLHAKRNPVAQNSMVLHRGCGPDESGHVPASEAVQPT